LNGETINISGGNLTINSDVRWNQQAAVFGNLFFTATLKGSLLVDGRDVWEIPFDASTGNVPTQGALGTNGVTGGTSGATGELLRVWTAGTLTPIAADGAMPATGYIKLRTKVGTFQDNEIITLPGGATITVNSATGGQRSWIHLVGAENTALSVGELATCEFLGDWYYIGETNGTDDQTFQYPVSDLCPAFQMETSAGSGVYEWWLYAGDRWGTVTQFVDTDARGKYYGQDLATGVITIARRATNACGYKPPSGCKVRIPNIILSNSTSANWNANTINATMGSRFESSIGNNGTITVKYAGGPWYWNSLNGNKLIFENVTTSRTILHSDCSGYSTFDGLAICPDGVSASPFAATRHPNGFRVTNARGSNSIGSTSFATFAINECNNVTLTNCFAESFGSAGAADTVSTVGFSISNVVGATLTDCVCIGTRFRVTSSANVTATGNKYASIIRGTTTATGVNGYEVTNASNGVRITGFANFAGIANVHPRSNVILINAASANCIVEDIGTYAAPYDCGTVNGTTTFLNMTNVLNSIARRCYSINNTSASTSMAAGSSCNKMVFRNCGGSYTKPSGNQWGIQGNARGIQQSAFPLVTAGVGNFPGLHFLDGFTSATVGAINIFGQAPTTETASQCVYSFSGNSGFSGGGGFTLATVNDSIEWTMPYRALGHTGLTAVTGLNANVTSTFQWDIGSGWNGTWTALTDANLVAVGAIDPAVGVALKVRLVCAVAATNSFANIRIATTSTATDQQILYPYDNDASGLIENLVAGSRIQIYNDDTNTELYNGSVASTLYIYEYLNGTNISVGDIIRIRVAKLGYLPQTLIAIATATGFSAAANQLPDDVYTSNAIDGSTVTEFTADYPNVQIDISDPDQITTVQRIYAWIRYTETTNTGIAQWFNAIVASDDVNYEINASVLNLKLDNTQPTPVLIGGGRLFKSDGSSVISPTSSSIQMDPQRIYSTGGGSGGSLTAADVWNYGTRTLTSGAAPSAATIASAVRTELTTELNRIDVATSTRLPTTTYTSPPTSAQNASAVRSELATELGRIDVAISTRNSIAPDNASITAIKAKTDNLPAIPAAQGDIPTAMQNASAVRSELSTELARIDVATSTRLATATYSSPPTALQNASAVRSELAVELGRIDVAISTRNSVAPDNASITAIKAKTDNLPAVPAAQSDIPTAIQNASAVRTELNTELGRIDANISSRSSVEPDNASITAIKAKTDNLPAVPAAKSDIPTAPQNAAAVRTELTTELNRLDVAVSTRNATAPDNASIAAIKAKTDNLPANPAAVSDIPSSAGNASAVRTELATELGRIDVAVSTRNSVAPDNASIAAIKTKTDNLPSDPASEGNVDEAIKAAKLAAAISASI
jgi:hypothetical protein